MTTTPPPKRTRRDIVPPQTSVSVYDALYGRQMASRYKDAPVPREAVQRLLDVSVWAPNHRMTEPWRFVLMERDSPLRRRLSDLVYSEMLREMQSEERAEAYRTRVVDPPIVAYAYCVRGKDEFETKENYASVVIAVHNMALAGVAEGLSVGWETGRVTRVPGLADLFGAGDDWDMVAMISIGYPDEDAESSRTDVSAFARWG